MDLSACTRPDIALALGNLAKLSSKPAKQHWPMECSALCYLRAIMNYEIKHTQGSDHKECSGSSDIDSWAGDVNNNIMTVLMDFWLPDYPH